MGAKTARVSGPESRGPEGEQEEGELEVAGRRSEVHPEHVGSFRDEV